ncbi:VOC family protein [Streptomyces sp. NPDC056121]|uniref:VOC family protein n=1 Tax=unclassified Streptomyces TaxID=2593676 RepID=UPI0035DB891F
MRANRIIANLHVADVDAAKSFYTEYLGLCTEEFNMGWVARYTSPETGVNIQLVTRDATSSEDSVVSVLTDDVDSAYAEAQPMGFEIVRPLTTEAWGVRRFDAGPRRDYVRDSAPTALRLKLPAGRRTAHLLTGDPNTFNRPLIVRVDGDEKARSEQLDGREFTWHRIPLDGGPSGGEVDLELSAREDETRHLSACVVVADDLGPVSK